MKKRGRSVSDSTKSILEAAPALAERGLSKKEAASELGIPTSTFARTVAKRRDIQWRDGRKDGGAAHRLAHERGERAEALALQGFPLTEIGRQLGITHQRVSQIIRKRGVERHHAKGRRELARTKRIERLKAECSGMTAVEASWHLGVPVQTIYKDRRKSGFVGLVMRSPNWRRQLSEQTKRIIATAPSLAERGFSQSDAARELGVSPPNFISSVRRYLPDVKWRNGRGG